MALFHSFTDDHAASDEDLRALLGGKGAGLAQMTAAGLPVPPGFTLTTSACRSFLAIGWSDEIESAIDEGVATLEQTSGKTFGSTTDPLLVSVRSGAAVSMPGMMDTALNVGMTPAVADTLATLTGDPAFAADTHRRALLSYATVVGEASDELLARAAATTDPAQVAAVLAEGGVVMPADPIDQVKAAVRAVFNSWLSPRAARYRQIEGIDEGLGTAATVQAMVFGNLGDDSGTGVAFSRNPTSGERQMIGDFLVGAQGEDVVSGTSVTTPIDDMAHRWPDLHDQLLQVAGALEQRHRDMVDIEFTVERRRLWMLQSRRGKRSPVAALRIAIDMAEDPAFPLDRAEAVERCRHLLDNPPTEAVDQVDDLPVVAEGLAASPGSASGVLCLDPDKAVELNDAGTAVILARRETSPADVHGMAASAGLFTTLGGLVSHAALVAREWGLPAVVGASEVDVVDDAIVTSDGRRIEAGTSVTVDGHRGQLLLGVAAGSGAEVPEVAVIRSWVAEGGVGTDRASTGTDGSAEQRSTSPEAPLVAAVDDRLRFGLLHALRIKGMATTETLAAMAGATPQAATTVLDEMLAAEMATFMEPRSFWVISPAGREAHADSLADAVAKLELTGLPYQRFLELNDDFKQLCTDWQIRNGEPNDHSDDGYDAGIRQRLSRFDDEAQPVIAALTEHIGWLGPYGPRLEAARGRIEAEDPKALTGVMCDSYHDIWMELHEDLILTQGIDRAAEGST